jgi:hypothetical protein
VHVEDLEKADERLFHFLSLQAGLQH